MSFSQPRPYRPADLSSPSSFDSLRPPHSISASGQTSPSSSSDGVDGAFATLHGQGRRGGQRGHEGGRPQPPKHPGNGKHEHTVLHLGGTGLKDALEDPRLKRKRVLLMTICGTVIVGIIVLAVLGCKGML